MAKTYGDIDHLVALLEYGKILNVLNDHTNRNYGVNVAFLTDWFPGYPRITTSPCDKLYLGVKYSYSNDKMDYLGTFDFSSSLRDILLDYNWQETNPGKVFVIKLSY